MSRQRGIALITALLVVALATTAAVAMVSRQQIEIRRTGNLLDGEQAMLYVFGVEDWAGQILRDDRKKNAHDHLGEDWASVLPPLPIEGGQLSGYVEDLQGRFNLNNLLDANGQASPADVGQFRELLAVAGVNLELADALVDWLDADLDATVPAGAEDPAYLGLELPYRAANRPMRQVSELRLVAGFNDPLPPDLQTPKECLANPSQPPRTTYEALEACITVLPQRTAINVNTAPIPVLMSLSAGLSAQDAQSLRDGGSTNGYDDINTFLQHPVLAGRAVNAGAVTVASDHFAVSAEVTVGRVTTRMRSLLWRDQNGSTRVVERAQETM